MKHYKKNYFLPPLDIIHSRRACFLYNSLKKAMFNIHFQPILRLPYSSKYIYHLEEGDVDEGGIEVDELKGNISEFFFEIPQDCFFPYFLVITTCIVANAGKIDKKQVVRNDYVGT